MQIDKKNHKMAATLENNQHAKHLKIEVGRAFNYQLKPLFKIFYASSETQWKLWEMEAPQKKSKDTAQTQKFYKHALCRKTKLINAKFWIGSLRQKWFQVTCQYKDAQHETTKDD